VKVGDVVLDGLSARAKGVLRNAIDGPINVETIGRLTRSYLLATPGCGPRIADEIISWARGLGMLYTE
jgi:hypothetical protein